MMNYNPAQALELLRSCCNKQTAVFHEHQEEAIRHIVEEKGNLLLVQRTGWGKSAVYFITTKLLCDDAGGTVILISPLLALMRDQLEAAKRMGIRAEKIDSSMEQWEQDEVERKCQKNEVDILVITPERIANEYFIQNILAPLRPSLLVIDEAHCISDWGHDFRPHYRRIGPYVDELPPNTKILATTATANTRVMNDLMEVLGTKNHKLHVLRGNLDRPSLKLQTIPMLRASDRLAWLAEKMSPGGIDGTGIIYASTITAVEQVTDRLKSKGVNAKAYHAGKSKNGEKMDRKKLEKELMENQLKVLVATTALGMGIDKPDLSFVIHYQRPGSAIAYYQQVGRAGRALPTAQGILLSGYEDARIINNFIKNAFPSRHEIETVLSALKSNETGLTVFELEEKMKIEKNRIEKTLLHISLEKSPPIIPMPQPKGPNKWKMTGVTFNDEAFWSRVNEVTKIRRREHKEMQKYMTLQPGEHMPFLLSALDNDPNNQ